MAGGQHSWRAAIKVRLDVDDNYSNNNNNDNNNIIAVQKPRAAPQSI